MKLYKSQSVHKSPAAQSRIEIKKKYNIFVQLKTYYNLIVLSLAEFFNWLSRIEKSKEDIIDATRDRLNEKTYTFLRIFTYTLIMA